MNYLWLYVAAVVGGIGGFFLCAILIVNNSALNWGKKRSLDADDVVFWIANQSPFERERLACLIVRRVYEGKRTIHKNPIRHKPGDKYPVSER